MVHYIALFRLPKEKSEEEIEAMIRKSRTCFHKVLEARNFRSGRNIDTSASDFGFFISADFENLDRLNMFRDDPNFHRFEHEVVRGGNLKKRELIFETDPGKDPKYS